MMYLLSNPAGSIYSPFTSIADVLSAYSSASLGTTVWMVNPCVPAGVSRLWKISSTGTSSDWVPPSGELLMREIGKTAPLYDQVIGVQSFIKLYQSPNQLPSYMVADGVSLRLRVHACIANSTPVAGVSIMSIVASAEPGNVEPKTYPIGDRNFTPTIDGRGMGGVITGTQTRNGVNWWHGMWCATEANMGALATEALRINLGGVAGGDMRFYLMAKTTHANDRAQLNSYDVTAA